MKVQCAMAAVIILAGSLGGCDLIQTRSTVVLEQPAPLVVNVNLTGRLELVITDARQDLETITGQKAKREVRPEDIGLPAEKAGTLGPTMEEGRVAMLVDLGGDAPRLTLAAAGATEEQLVKEMAGRNAKVRELLSAHVAGEGHDGLLAEKGKLSAEQKGTLDAENADRTALYALRAAKAGTTVKEASLAYYLQRLGYAEKGDWVETYNKEKKVWEWVQWSK